MSYVKIQPIKSYLRFKTMKSQLVRCDAYNRQFWCPLINDDPERDLKLRAPETANATVFPRTGWSTTKAA